MCSSLITSGRPLDNMMLFQLEFRVLRTLVIGLAKASTLLVDPRKFGHLEAGLNAHDTATSHLSPKVRKTQEALTSFDRLTLLSSWRFELATARQDRLIPHKREGGCGSVG
jgi:hypothetical protein